jgi:hypothetical protein
LVGLRYNWIHTNYDCAGGSAIGNTGIEGKTPGIGKNVDMTSADMFTNNYSTLICSFDFPNKFKIGGKWSLWCSLNATTGFLANSGILLSGKANAQGSNKSTMSAVKAIVAERRGKRQ